MQTIQEEVERRSHEPSHFGPGPESLDPDRDKLVRVVGDGWNEYVTNYGRCYYYNTESHETSWKPPRKNLLTQVTILRKKKREYSFGSGTLPGSSTDDVRGVSNPSRLSLQDEYETTPAERGWPPYDRIVARLEGDKCVGRLLKTGTLNTAAVGKNGAKKRWVTSYVVLTEYYIIFTAQPGFLQKLFRKSKSAKVHRFHLPEVFVRRESALSKKCNVYRLTALSRELLFTTDDGTQAEMWYQILKLVSNQLAVLEGDSQHEDPDALKLNKSAVSLPHLVIPRAGETSFSVAGGDADDAPLPRASSGSPLQCKHPTPPGWIDRYDPSTGKFYYVNSVTGRKWFSEMSVDGTAFFFEEGTGRASWLLPPVYQDIAPKASAVYEGPVKSTAV